MVEWNSTTTGSRTASVPPPSARKTGFLSGAEAGERSAILYTIVEACRRQGIDPFAYLRDVFTRLPSMTTGQIASITPANWAKALLTTTGPIAA